MNKLDWSLYPNFTIEELRCKYTSECQMRPEFMKILQEIRDDYGKPIFISSGYRSIKHPVEQAKERPGEHTLGMSVDILCYGTTTLELLKLAQQHGIQRIGLSQKGDIHGSRFMHIGIADRFYLGFPAGIWTY